MDILIRKKLLQIIVGLSYQDQSIFEEVSKITNKRTRLAKELTDSELLILVTTLLEKAYPNATSTRKSVS